MKFFLCSSIDIDSGEKAGSSLHSVGTVKKKKKLLAPAAAVNGGERKKEKNVSMIDEY